MSKVVTPPVDLVPVSDIEKFIIPDTPQAHRLIDLLREAPGRSADAEIDEE